jgi:hypothetical protein
MAATACAAAAAGMVLYATDRPGHSVSFAANLGIEELSGERRSPHDRPGKEGGADGRLAKGSLSVCKRAHEKARQTERTRRPWRVHSLWCSLVWCATMSRPTSS